MIKIKKKNGTKVRAYRLGEKSPVLEELIREKKIKPLLNGSFEVMSQEAVLGGSRRGEIAYKGDYIKLDSAQFPYPNTAAFFEANHKWLAGEEYEQIPKPMDAWTIKQPMCEEVEFLIQKKGLEIRENDPEHYFNVFLWGTKESAGIDAVIVFYSIMRNEIGEITDADFNFIQKSEFDKTYDVINTKL